MGKPINCYLPETDKENKSFLCHFMQDEEAKKIIILYSTLCLYYTAT